MDFLGNRQMGKREHGTLFTSSVRAAGQGSLEASVMLWAVLVKHEITRETYAIGPFDNSVNAYDKAREMVSQDPYRTYQVIKFVKAS